MKNSLEFYTRELDFELKWSWSDDARFEPTGEPEFACIESGEAVLFLSATDGGVGAQLFVELPFVEDLDALAAKATRSNILGPPENQPWGSREFLLRDPDGHVLRFSCPVDRHKTG